MQRVFKDGARDAGVLVVKGDERIPGDERDVERNRWIGESDFSEGKFSAEIAFCESWETLKSTATKPLALQALVEDLECREGAFNEPCDWRSTLDVDNCERSLWRVGSKSRGKRCRLGPGLNRKVLQPSIAVETDAARADATDGHRYLRGSVAVEGALRAGLKESSTK